MHSQNSSFLKPFFVLFILPPIGLLPVVAAHLVLPPAVALITSIN